MGIKQVAFKIKWVHSVLLLATATLVLGTPFIDNPYYLDTLITILLWAGLAGAWNISGGYAGQLSLGHGAFFGIGAYTSTVLLLTSDLSPFVGMFAGASLAMLVAIGIGAVCFRLKGPFFVLATLAFGEVAHIAAINWRSITGGANGLQIPYDAGWLNFTFLSEKPYVYIAFLYLIIVYASNKYMEHSRLGYQLAGIREDEEAARSLGVNSWRAKLLALGISAFLTALGGTFYAQYIQIIDPDSTFSWTVSIQPALLTIVGGLGTAAGPILGSIIMIPMSQVIRVQLGGTYSGAHLAVYGVILIAIVLFLPRGLYDVVRKAPSEVWGKTVLRSKPE